ncbi:hypothetical protein [Halobellus litoreus]|uniref:Polyketide cyclase / dehydrase and lipid transport n=1 Tax=Halobellus litoreus TaxID=755310 RepID=A0ABD6DY53_9EURY|nr:hypothetical protein [Halobellus litoreus]
MAAVSNIAEEAPRPAGKTWRRRLGWVSGGALLGIAYWTLVRPRMLNWGATPAEVRASLPGDDRLPDADAESTMAISIDAPPDEIWPWLRQVGQERGGFYSHEWAENLVGLDIHNADRLVPEWQDLSVGDTVRLGREDRFPDATLDVVGLDPERSLILQTPDEPTWWVWSFVLDPIDDATTRLLVRSRIRLPENPVVGVLARVVLDPITSVMTHGMLGGIRSRAERIERLQAETEVSGQSASP